MKETKFRAWTDQGTYGSFRMVYDVGIIPYQSRAEWNENGFGLFLKPQSRHILMEFTGLKDKNGVEIYEGDICKYWMDGNWKMGEIGWLNGGWAIEVRKFGNKKVDWLFKFQSFIPVPEEGSIIMGDQFEVIGNIYENPNLLK